MKKVSKINEIVELRNFIKKFENKKFKLINKNGNFVDNKFLFFYFFLSSKKLNKSNILNMLIDYMNKAEINFPGSSLLLCKKIVKSYLGKNEENIVINRIKPNKKNLKLYLYKKFNKNSVELFFDILKESGPDCIINTEKSKNSIIEVELSNISSFDVYVKEEVQNLLFKNSNFITNKNFSLLVSDTYLEKESEIYTVLNKASKEKSRLIILCRGYSKDFIKEIKKMMLKSNIVIYPYVCKFNDNDPFELSDFSSVTGAKIISPDKGENINTFGKDYLIKLNNVKLFKNKIEINNLKNTFDRKSIKSSNNKELKNYNALRKKRLFNKKVKILIPENNKILFEDIKNICVIYNLI